MGRNIIGLIIGILLIISVINCENKDTKKEDKIEDNFITEFTYKTVIGSEYTKTHLCGPVSNPSVGVIFFFNNQISYDDKLLMNFIFSSTDYSEEKKVNFLFVNELEENEIPIDEEELKKYKANNNLDGYYEAFLSYQKIKNKIGIPLIWDKNHDMFKDFTKNKDFIKKEMPYIILIDKSRKVVKHYKSLTYKDIANIKIDINTLISKNDKVKLVEDNEIRILFSGMNKGLIHSANCPKCKGGLSLLSTVMDDYKKADEDIVIINTGNFMPNYFDENRLHKKYTLDVMNLMKFDFVVLGRFEYFTGTDFIKKIADSMNVLATNLDSQLIKTKKYEIKEIGDSKVAFISLFDGKIAEPFKRFSLPNAKDDKTTNLIENISFKNIDEILPELIKELKSKSDAIVAITHFKASNSNPFENEKKLIETYPEIKVVVDANTHHDINGKNYEIVNDGIIISIDKNAFSITDLHVSFDDAGKLKYHKLNNIPITKYYTFDDRIVNLNTQFKDELKKKILSE